MKTKLAAVLAIAVVVSALSGCVLDEIVQSDIGQVVIDTNHPPEFSPILLANGIPGETRLVVTNRYWIDMNSRRSSYEGAWTGIRDMDGDAIVVTSVRAWFLLDGETVVEDTVYCAPYEEGVIHASMRAGESNPVANSFVLYPGTGQWPIDTSDGVQLICPYPEDGYAAWPMGWRPFLSGESCYSRYHEACRYFIEITATDGKVVVSKTYVLELGASWASETCPSGVNLKEAAE